MSYSYYKPTGFPLGRPRIGEIRPETPKMISARKYREENKDWLPAYNRIKGAAYRSANKAHVKHLARMSKIRTDAYYAWVEQHNKKIEVKVQFTTKR